MEKATPYIIRHGEQKKREKNTISNMSVKLKLTKDNLTNVRWPCVTDQFLALSTLKSMLQS